MAIRTTTTIVDDTATVATIDAHLAAAMRRPMRQHRVDGYRFGGGVTGGWDPTYDPQADPAKWRPCGTCAAATGSPRTPRGVWSV